MLATHDLPVWPHIEVADIVRDAARVCVDEDMFVPARTLSVAVARMNDGEGDNIDIIKPSSCARYPRSRLRGVDGIAGRGEPSPLG